MASGEMFPSCSLFPSTSSVSSWLSPARWARERHLSLLQSSEGPPGTACYSSLRDQGHFPKLVLPPLHSSQAALGRPSPRQQLSKASLAGQAWPLWFLPLGPVLQEVVVEFEFLQGGGQKWHSG